MNDKELEQMLQDMERTTRERDMRKAAIRVIVVALLVVLAVVVLSLIAGCTSRKPACDGTLLVGDRVYVTNGDEFETGPMGTVIGAEELKGSGSAFRDSRVMVKLFGSGEVLALYCRQVDPAYEDFK